MSNSDIRRETLTVDQLLADRDDKNEAVESTDNVVDESSSRPLHWRDQRREGHCADGRDPPVDDAARDDAHGQRVLHDFPRISELSMRHRREAEEEDRERERVKQELIDQARAERDRVHRDADIKDAERRLNGLETGTEKLASVSDGEFDMLHHEIARITRRNAELEVTLSQVLTELADLKLARGSERSSAVDVPLRSTVN
jgi:hypothetical protein